MAEVRGMSNPTSLRSDTALRGAKRYGVQDFLKSKISPFLLPLFLLRSFILQNYLFFANGAERYIGREETILADPDFGFACIITRSL